MTPNTTVSVPVATGNINGKPIEVFTLFYRQGMNPHPLQKQFNYFRDNDGQFRKAIERGKNHCEVMGLKFLMVRPFMSDLEFDEKRATE